MVFSLVTVHAAELFVSPSGGHVPPFSDWLTAATNIQSAIDAAASGDVVTVTNGIYANGGKVKAGDLTNRIAIDKPILVRSVNGPWVTTILGAGAANGTAAVRGAWLTNGAVLEGFTISGGATRAVGDGLTLRSGGGVWCVSTNANVANCIIRSNTSHLYGSALYQGTLKNSYVISNTVTPISNGAVANSDLINCTVVSNLSFGVVQVLGGVTRVTNSIVYYNPLNYSGGTFAYGCSTPLPTGTGNISSDPLLRPDGVRLSSSSPCRGAGLNVGGGVDLFGQAWGNPPSMGCAEWSGKPELSAPPRFLPGPQGQLRVSITLAEGQEPIAYSWLKDNAAVSGSNYGGQGTIQLVINKLGPADAGGYQVVASNAFGMTTSAVATLTIRCVNFAGVSPTPPYADWSAAATNIQTAIDASAIGEIVLVTNGVYGFGGKVMAGDLTNRVVLDKPLIVMSVNGPTYSTIQATPGLGGVNSVIAPNNTNAVRCAWLGDGAVLSGFTLRGGGTRASSSLNLGSGGGVLCASQSALISYCNIQENAAYYQGGGVYSGTLNNCTISLNGVGIFSGSQFISGQGGGAYGSVLNNCLIRANQAGGTAVAAGGGAFGGSLNNCTVIQNIGGGSTSEGAGTYNSQVRNCIVRNNTTRFSALVSDIYGGTASYTCYGSYLAGSGGVGNITSDPLFLSDGFHLSSTSSCRDAGNAAFTSGTDIDGQTWTNPPSMGCDEWLPEPVLLNFKMQASHWNQFDFNTLIAGIESSPGYWLKDGVTLSESIHYVGAGTTALAVKGVSASDSGNYQLIVSNAFGMTTSRVANVVIHFANAGNPGATAPYTTWATAAGTIQDAVDAASTDGVILVANGLYNTGGKPHVPWLTVTNRVTLDKPVVVASVNGPFQTVIEGQWDPVSTNGPNAIRCALLTTNSSLAGFTLRNGAAESNGQGGGIGAFFDELVSSCVISNNRAHFGAGAVRGSYNNCWFVNNQANAIAGAVYAGQWLNNCTVIANTAAPASGGGVWATRITNSIIWFNSTPNALIGNLYNSASPGIPQVSGNITNDPQLVDGLHLAVTSPCRGAGANILSSATDLDGDVWLIPPSMGADEFNAAALVGPLSVNIEAPTSTLMNRAVSLIGRISGRATGVKWDFGDGVVLTNVSYFTSHVWTNPGDYVVTFTAFNTDNPGGVSAAETIHVDPVLAPTLAAGGVLNSTNFQFQFTGQAGANYTVQYATNLAAPTTWLTVTSLTSTGGVMQIVDTRATNAARFYRVRAQ